MMEITSTAFKNEGWIPKRYTSAGENLSPPLRWSGEPEECKGFAILCEDPDAKSPENASHPFIHWIAYQISPAISALPEGILQRERVGLPVSMDQGKNSFGEIGYKGPLPPIGRGKHHYRFRIYALRKPLGIPPGASADEFYEALKGHVIETAEWVGIYERDLSQSIMT